MAAALLGCLVVIALAAVGFVAWAVRAGRLEPEQAWPAATLCGVTLLVLVVSDWPTGWLSEFGAEHSILGAMLTTVLTIGVGFLGYEAHDARVQRELRDKVTAAGLGGILEPVSTVRAAIEMVSGSEPPRGWVPPSRTRGRPLKWMDATQRVSMLVDSVSLQIQHEWQRDLLDQAIRRLATTMRDWGALISSSRKGLTLLTEMGKLRNALMLLQRSGSASQYVAALDLAKQIEQAVGTGSTPEGV